MTQENAALELEIKILIIDALALEDVAPEDIVTTEPLFVNGLGLDSIDALELGMALQRAYGVTVTSDSNEMRNHFRSVETLAEFVRTQRGIEKNGG